MVEIQKRSLKAAIDTVLPAVAGKSTLPVLSHVRVQVDEGEITLAATNLEIGMVTRVQGKGEGVWGVCVPAKLFADIINALPDDVVTLTFDPQRQELRVKAGKFTNTLKGIEVEEFPNIPMASVRPVLSLPAAEVRAALLRVVGSAATDDSRPVLSGGSFTVGGGMVTFVTADGFRLSLDRVSHADNETTMSLVIPATTLATVARLVKPSEAEVYVVLTEGGTQAIFTVGETTLVSRLIDGKYPDIARIVPAPETEIVTAVTTLADAQRAAKIAALFAEKSQNTVKATFTSDSIVLTANADEVGDAEAVIPATVTLRDGVTAACIGLNVRYLADALGSLAGTDVRWGWKSEKAPVTLRPTTGETLHLVMPMTLR